jgi:hypothetical protein
VPHQIIKKLFDSLDSLERSIALAKRALHTQEPVAENMLKRVAYYEEVLVKQRKLAHGLCGYIAEGNWLEVTRHIKLINGLSSLIHEDAQNFVTEIFAGKRVNNNITCS